jgi:Ser/Thr protein kinase RdoA (MazF antagonist)
MADFPALARLEASYATSSAQAVADFAASEFGLPHPVRCALLSRGFNDCFDLTAGDGRRYVLRISGRRLRGLADVRSETEFLKHLEREGVAVTSPAPTVRGPMWTSVELPRGECPVVLFRYLDGRKPDPRSTQDARAQGVPLARVHEAAPVSGRRRPVVTVWTTLISPIGRFRLSLLSIR